MQEFLKVLYTSLASIVVLFFLTKIMGNRQMSQLSLFDYINGITIGSIAAEMATSPEDYKVPLLAMVVYGTVAVLIAIVTDKSIKMRRFIAGKPTVIYEDGKIYRENLKKTKVDLSEFLTQCRNSGYFDLANIQTAILETNGRISFLPVSAQRPATPQDLNIAPAQEKPVANVIMDGKIMNQNLKNTGNDPVWLREQLQAQGVKDSSQVFLATCDSNNKLTIYVKFDKKMSKDYFE